MATILVTGAGGMLGSAFRIALADHAVIPVGRADLDPAAPDRLRTMAERHGADILINCAADTDVEGAESDPRRAMAVNGDLPGYLAEGCRKAGALMVQISSTGIYGDWKATPYTEDDTPKPTTAHHRAKLTGEEAVRAAGGETLILRAGWLYGGAASNPKNFVARRLENARGQTRMAGNAGQRGNPTSVEDFVRQALILIGQGRTGLFNCVAHGSASRADYVRAIVQAAGLDCIVEDAPAAQFVRKAAVSPNEMAINARLAALGLDRMPDWPVSLAAYVRTLI